MIHRGIVFPLRPESFDDLIWQRTRSPDYTQSEEKF
jgi:hypothetical protein